VSSGNLGCKGRWSRPSGAASDFTSEINAEIKEQTMKTLLGLKKIITPGQRSPAATKS